MRSFIGIFIFSIVLSVQVSALTIQTPNGGEVWTYGNAETTSWTGKGLGSVVKIEFSYDGGTNWWYFGEVPSGPNGGNASVSVPNIATSNAILKITDVNNPAVSDISNAPFTVYIPPISVWEPSGNSVVFANSLAQVYWFLNVTGITMLNAEISLDNGSTYTPVAENIYAMLGFTYLNLSDVTSETCILKLYNADNPSQYGLSSVFQIRPLPVYNFTAPTAGKIVNTFSQLTISWDV